MPAVILKVTKKCSAEQKQDLAIQLSNICAEDIGKPVEHMMALVHDEVVIYLGNEAKNAAFVEVRSIGGLNNEVNTAITSDICALLQESLDIEPTSVYINFTNMERAFWGSNSKTFA